MRGSVPIYRREGGSARLSSLGPKQHGVCWRPPPRGTPRTSRAQTTPEDAVAYHLIDTDVGRGAPQTTPRATRGRAGCVHDRGRIFAGLPAAGLLGTGARVRLSPRGSLLRDPARAHPGVDRRLRGLRAVP